MVTENEIIEFIKEETYEKKVSSDTDIFNGCGVSGDDCSELLEKYCNIYKVDMSNYLWYFHHSEEGSASIGSGFFKSPDERVTRIPITPKILTQFANSKKWEIEYPEHTLPKRRYDILINQIIFAGLICFIIYKCFVKNPNS